MDRILIDIDNDNPGAIIKQITECIIPRCLLYSDRNILSISSVNRYFNRAVKASSPRQRTRHCQVERLWGRQICKRHTLDYADLKQIHQTIEQERERRCTESGELFIHFRSKELADKAVPFVKKHLGYTGRCCGGLGFRLGHVTRPCQKWKRVRGRLKRS